MAMKAMKGKAAAPPKARKAAMKKTTKHRRTAMKAAMNQPTKHRAKAMKAVMKATKDAKRKNNKGKEKKHTLWWHLNTEGVKAVELKIEYTGKLHIIMDYKNLSPKAYVVLDDLPDA